MDADAKDGTIILLGDPADPASTVRGAPAPTVRHPFRVTSIDIGDGPAIGVFTGQLALSNGTLTSGSATGGSGGGLEAELWFDDWPWRDTAFALQYIKLENRADLSANMPDGVSVLTDPVNAHLGVGVAADLLFANLAYRPQARWGIRPVIGAGLGIGYGTASENNQVYNAFIGASSGSTRSSSFLPMLQAFSGVEVNLPKNIYFSFTPRILWMSARPIGKSLQYTDVILDSSFGYRFR